jgi:dGTPase
LNWSQLLSPRRQNQKPGVNEQSRSAFEQDFDRIIFSHPFRKLQDKTQVHPLPEHDFVHTRLTHSLEVSSVGRSLGKRVGEVIMQRHGELEKDFSSFDFGAITAAASLAHDMGNPPFGHAGESAISSFFADTEHGIANANLVNKDEMEDLRKFEGNAQGFRLINRKDYGLRLTYATLGAFTKYPCHSSSRDRDTKRRSQKKFGYFQTEKEAFADVADNLGLIKFADGIWSRHPLAFLVEAADDICYSIIDLEDACRLGLVTFNETVDLLEPILGTKLNKQKLSESKGLNAKLGMLRAMTIGELIDACTEIFLENETGILDASFDKALTDICKFKEPLGIINKVSVEKIYRTHSVVEIEASGHEILPALVNDFIKAAENVTSDKVSGSRKYQNMSLLFPEDILLSIKEHHAQRYLLLRDVLDFVSGLTDRHALALYRKIKGISF